MAPKILKIRTYPDKILSINCKPVDVVDEDIRELMDDMLFTMRFSKGIGLAAPQVGFDKRIIVVDIGDGAVKLVNPRVTKSSGKSIMEEGCLSLPEIQIKVKRAQDIEVAGLNESSKEVIVKASGLLATVLQHEIDHLNGVLLVDYTNIIKKTLFKNKLKKLKGKVNL